ncbi:hypothetical protein HJC23_008874 [Cyclotella cryptica]|uniref:Uncharacterized protein n=1 Tax=Cyclotella cryptica TaxID=29204 RepID=A0ABD3PFU8_9STRA
MSNCSAMETALDRILHSALQQQQQQGHPNGIAAAASHHAVSTFGSLLGSMTSTALAGPKFLVMPAAPMETLLHSSSPMGNSSMDMCEAFLLACLSSMLITNPHHGYHRHPLSLHSSPLHIMSPPQPQAMHHHPMMMMQQQYQMIQQMQMQQMHMAAMVEHQQTMQPQQQQPPMSGRQTRHAVPLEQTQSGTHSVAMPQTSVNETISLSQEDDVLTVGNGKLDEIYNEGKTDPVSWIFFL